LGFGFPAVHEPLDRKQSHLLNYNPDSKLLTEFLCIKDQADLVNPSVGSS